MPTAPVASRTVRAWIALARFAAWGLPVAALAFLLITGFFDAWNGRIAAQRPPDPESNLSTVLVVPDAEDAEPFERELDRRAVDPLGLEELRRPLVPRAVPDDAPLAWKERFTLHLTVQTPAGRRDLPTTSPGALGVAVLVLLALLALRNMVVARSPLAILPPDPGTLKPIRALPKQGQIAHNRRGGRGKGPPPAKKRKAVGRRRK